MNALRSILPGKTWRVDGGPRRRRLAFGKTEWVLKGTQIPRIEGVWRIDDLGALILQATHVDPTLTPFVAEGAGSVVMMSPLCFASVMVAAALADRARDTPDFASLSLRNNTLRYVPVHVTSLRLDLQVQVGKTQQRTVWTRV